MSALQVAAIGATARLLTLRQVAERLAVDESTIWRWRNERRLPVVKVGRVVRVNEQALEGWLAKFQQGEVAQ